MGLLRRSWFVLTTSVYLIFACGLSYGEALTHSLDNLTIPYSPLSLTMDGELDDNIWKSALSVPMNIVNDPWENQRSPVKTQAKIIENGEYIYIAFIAQDPQIENIKAFLSDRDSAWTDDLVGIKLDTFNSRRLNYEFFVNPFGVQNDAIANEVTGDRNDLWDGLWQSYGKMTTEGYQVEIAIPYSSLNFTPGNKIKTWAIELVRLYPRDERLRISHIPLDRNNPCWICQMPEISGFEQAKMGNNLKLTPSLVASQESSRDIFTPSSDWQQENDFEAGLDLNWGITTNTQLNATINPDFSTVEADSGQLSVNKTFSLFYDEKRSFFLENADYFASNYNLVHTRNISDPDYGIKLTGRESKHSYGVFITNDTQTNFIKPGNIQSSLIALDQESHSAAINYRYDQSDNLTFGVTSTLRAAEDYHNALLSVDSKYRLNDSNAIIAQLLHSDTNDAEQLMPLTHSQTGQQTKFNDLAYKIVFEHDSQYWQVNAQHQQIGKDFRADLGFMTKADFKESELTVNRIFYGTYNSLFSEVELSSEWTIRHNENNEFIARILTNGVQITGPMLSEIDIEYEQATKVGLRDNQQDQAIDDNSQTFSLNKLTLYGEFQPTARIYLGLRYICGDEIDYRNDRAGKIRGLNTYLQINATDHLFLNLYQNFSKLDADHAQVYKERLTDLRISYQFDVKNGLELSLVYADIDRNETNNPFVDNSNLGKTKQLSTKLIYSYKLNSQSVFYLGYSDNSMQDHRLSRLERQQKTFFSKISYAWMP